ncbi:guanine nucleotide exchange factor DBS-like [Harmonia axyridis]|uniref:guanine nucleotide exchange factor DBS-like n=1 Tax=Harmonia axyridis TaxID=115357 RepID=UPI001E274EA6|nr:guanine nucleotide exchange factor DBS-like [Harmonia axyridis]XP_045481934.1 guanine nucleotide exchange factor DBS-like [Harmonia axyridis]
MDMINPCLDEKLVTSDDKTKRCRVLTELLETERVYVAELHTILTGYRDEFFAEDMQNIVPTISTEVIEIIFGNIDEIYHFHSDFLKDLEECIHSIGGVASCFMRQKDNFYLLYSYYCQNLSASEQVRESLVDSYMFFETCQKKLGHKLPLAAYLLKPVQRITKYHLLLKELLQCLDSKSTQQALECMLVVLQRVNDSMHQVSITGSTLDLPQQGKMLLQGEFSVWTENKKDIRLRLKPSRRQVFLYQRSMIFCKLVPKTSHNKSSYQFKFHLRLSQIGLTESVKGDPKKFEVWLRGRAEVYTLQAVDVEQKQAWVSKIKRVLLDQLEELRGEKIKEYAQTHRSLRQTTSWETAASIGNYTSSNRALSCDSEIRTYHYEDTVEFSDCSNSEDEEHHCHPFTPGRKYVALADYFAVGCSEVNMKEGDIVELLKIGCAGWWYVRLCGSSSEGWAPAAYLENIYRRSSGSSSRSQD